MVNKVILIGNLGKDPEVRRLESGVAVATFSMATSENYKDKSGEWQSTTEWHNIVVWRNMAERAESQLKKGSMIYIEGKLTHRSYDDKDGNKRYITEVVGNYFRNLTKREEGENRSFPTQEHAVSTSTEKAEESIAPQADDDLPF